MDIRSSIKGNLENWFAIDSILFNDHARNIIVRESDYNEYVSMKTALLSNLFEFWNHIGYSPKDMKYKNSQELQESSVKIARQGKTLASDLLNRPAIKEKLEKKIMKEAKKIDVKDFDKFSDKFINKSFYEMALDNVLTGIPCIECTNSENISNYKGLTLEEAHRMMRSHIVNLAMTCDVQSNSQ